MHRFVQTALLGLVCVCMRADDPGKPSTAAASPVVAAKPDVNPDEIIRKFAAKEKEFSEARGNYTYRQTVKVQALDDSGTPQGKYELVSDIVFSPEGKRTEHVVFAPVSTLSDYLLLTPEDEQDLRNIQPFVLTTDQISEYNIAYLGKQNADEISCYVFSVKPKKLTAGKRFFEGQIWVDDKDLQIVKTFGKAVGLLKRGEDQQFPKFETLREQIDGRYWFPTYTYADDTLHFKDHPQKIRMIVTYKDYKKFQGKSTITFGDVVDEQKKDQPKPEPKKP